MLDLVTKNDGRFFLSRPRRFGKSLTVSTLEAMFAGKSAIFKGFVAEEWVDKQSTQPTPVLRLDMSMLLGSKVSKNCDVALSKLIYQICKIQGIIIHLEDDSSCMLRNAVIELYSRQGPAAVLIDEYDAPILSNISDNKQIEIIHKVMRGFYSTLKTLDDYISFVLITGISKFSKVGLFSSANNLNDISQDSYYASILGYTQQELERYFADRIDFASEKMNLKSDQILYLLKNYYGGFSFDGKTRVYNPFDILSFFEKFRFDNFWYETGSPSFLADWVKEHSLQEPERYRHIQVSDNFTNALKIERTDPISVLFQAGYLTIEKK